MPNLHLPGGLATRHRSSRGRSTQPAIRLRRVPAVPPPPRADGVLPGLLDPAQERVHGWTAGGAPRLRLHDRRRRQDRARAATRRRRTARHPASASQARRTDRASCAGTDAEQRLDSDVANSGGKKDQELPCPAPNQNDAHGAADGATAHEPQTRGARDDAHRNRNDRRRHGPHRRPARINTQHRPCRRVHSGSHHRDPPTSPAGRATCPRSASARAAPAGTRPTSCADPRRTAPWWSSPG